MGPHLRKFYIQEEEATFCGLKEEQVIWYPDMGGEFLTQRVKTGKCKHRTKIQGAYSGGAGDIMRKVVGGPCIPVVLNTGYTLDSLGYF